MKKVDEVIKGMQEQAELIKKYASEKIDESFNEETKEKASQLVDKTLKVIDDAKDKIVNLAKEVKDEEKFNAFLNNITIKVQEVSDFTIQKVSELIPEKDKLDEIQKQITDSFDKVMANENIQNAVKTLQGIGDSVKDFFEKPETKAKINSAKKTTLNIAEKGMDHLRKILDTDDSKDKKD